MASKKNVQSAKKSHKNRSGNKSAVIRAGGPQGAGRTYSASSTGASSGGGTNAKKEQQGKVRRFFTVVICIVVALGLMIPVAGLGVASCGTQTQTDQKQSAPQ